HEVVIAGGFPKSAIEHFRWALVVALIELVVRFDHPAWGVLKTLAVGVFADIGQERMHRRFCLVARRTRLVGSHGGSKELRRVQFCRARFRKSCFGGL